VGENEKESSYLRTKKEQLSLRSYIYDEIENSDGDQEQIFQQVAELALKIVEGESCALYLYDEKLGEFYPQVTRSNDGSLRQNSVPFVAAIFKEVVAKKSALIVNSGSDPIIAPSLICVPLIISAYNKQSKVKMRLSSPEETKNSKYQDVVSLSQQGTDKAEAYKKISYSIIDVILKDKGV
ncbi:MAG: hypothetical protein L7F78_27255, partial [Syntrophales bacterium LBB04]|nr:hypothetical protein [Syntrophales bacterium LBB04]